VEEGRLGFRRIAKRPLMLSEEARVHEGFDIAQVHHKECSSVHSTIAERGLKGGCGRGRSGGTRRSSQRTSSRVGFTVHRDD